MQHYFKMANDMTIDLQIALEQKRGQEDIVLDLVNATNITKNAREGRKL